MTTAAIFISGPCVALRYDQEPSPKLVEIIDDTDYVIFEGRLTAIWDDEQRTYRVTLTQPCQDPAHTKITERQLRGMHWVLDLNLGPDRDTEEIDAIRVAIRAIAHANRPTRCDDCGWWPYPQPSRLCPTCAERCEPPGGQVPDLPGKPGTGWTFPNGWCEGECSTDCDTWQDDQPCGCLHHWTSCDCDQEEETR